MPRSTDGSVEPFGGVGGSEVAAWIHNYAWLVGAIDAMLNGAIDDSGGSI
ncbi:unnamed protein product [Acidithrix sp. C25]|nr:unnamed protein product [Acidithrix sp. C25]